MTTQFDKQVNNLVEIAAVLIREGKATIDNAFQMAIELDNQNIHNTIAALDDLKHERYSFGEERKARSGCMMVQSNVTNHFYTPPTQ